MCNVMGKTSQPDDGEIAQRAAELERLTTLSGREAEVVARKEAGETHSAIAERLGVEKGTVDSHAHRGRVKYNMAVTTAAELETLYGEE